MESVGGPTGRIIKKPLCEIAVLSNYYLIFRMLSAGIGTSFIAERLPWLHRASPSATLDKITIWEYGHSPMMSITKYKINKKWDLKNIPVIA
jgi:hypothetical protein